MIRLAAVVCGLPGLAAAQCVMCREAAASQRAEAVAALNAGILLLGVALIVVFLGIGRMILRWGRRTPTASHPAMR